MKNNTDKTETKGPQVEIDDGIARDVIEFAQKSGVTPQQMKEIDQIFHTTKEACSKTGNMVAVTEQHEAATQKAVFEVLMNASTAAAGRMMCGKGWGQNLFMSSMFFGEVAKFYGKPLDPKLEKVTNVQVDEGVAKILESASRSAVENELMVRVPKAVDDPGLDTVPHSNRVIILKDRAGCSFRPITRVEHSFLLTRLSAIVSRALIAYIRDGEELHSEQMGTVKVFPTGSNGSVILLDIALDCTLPEKVKKSSDRVIERMPAFKRTRDYSVTKDGSPSPTSFVASYVTSGVGWRAPRSITNVTVGFYLPKSTGGA